MCRSKRQGGRRCSAHTNLTLEQLDARREASRNWARRKRIADLTEAGIPFEIVNGVPRVLRGARPPLDWSNTPLQAEKPQ